jgi:hypothetical protein
VLSFLKRRWILLSCVVALVACSIFDLAHVSYESGYRDFGLGEGHFHYFKIPAGVTVIADRDQGGFIARLHRPMLGTLIEFEGEPYDSIAIPLWIPLSIVIGWIVWRELRWREKRARKAEQP